MSNRYEQSLKEQAARIRRELAGERETKPVERPKKEEREDRFVLTDVPSPIYGFQRPKQSASETVKAAEETETSEQVSETVEEGNTDEVTLTDQELIAPEVVLDEAEADAGLVPVTDVELLVPEPHTSEELVREEVLTVTEVEETDETETSSDSETVEQSADPTEVVLDEAEADAGLVPVTDVELLVPEPHTSEELVREEVPTVTEVEETDETETSSNSETVEQSVVPTETSSEESADEKEAEQQVESFAPTFDTSAIEVDQDPSVTEVDKPVQPEVKKPVGPPVNVVMTTKDLMAMYRARREQNNLHGKK
ncbi:hypothetical protein ITJ88_02705 [Exiguobacterium sp. TBG-PICH-001]|uniref:hypothetical protein n=1 Tax=Exiguobacterium abrahamii TaxID=2785532 RepID=UPI0018A6F783|nr:hypothetical protein [Exiguobacterium sp. TBG-PICH-001]MBF8152183.1 hypothetical protein [Exiguobacterium sp. TBG-PICH-001]